VHLSACIETTRRAATPTNREEDENTKTGEKEQAFVTANINRPSIGAFTPLPWILRTASRACICTAWGFPAAEERRVGYRDGSEFVDVEAAGR
jgi:hypothetical protein